MHAQAVLEGLQTANEALNINAVKKAKKAVAKGISLVSKRVKVIKIAERVTTVGLLCRNIYLMSWHSIPRMRKVVFVTKLCFTLWLFAWYLKQAYALQVNILFPLLIL